jgi:hypothetical protein
MIEKLRAGSIVWFSVHIVVFLAIMLLIVLSYPIFGYISDDEIAAVCVAWCILWIIEGIFGLWGWDDTTTD